MTLEYNKILHHNSLLHLLNYADNNSDQHRMEYMILNQISSMNQSKFLQGMILAL